MPFARYQTLHCRDDVRGNQHRIDSRERMRGVSGLAMNDDFKIIDGRHHRTAFEADGSNWNIRPRVQSKKCVNVQTMQKI